MEAGTTVVTVWCITVEVKFTIIREGQVSLWIYTSNFVIGVDDVITAPDDF